MKINSRITSYSIHYTKLYDYNWRESGNPCSDAYYSPEKKLISNILASDLGIIAKSGSDNNLRVFIRDLRTADPVEGASAEIRITSYNVCYTKLLRRLPDPIQTSILARRPRRASRRNSRGYSAARDQIDQSQPHR